MAVKKLIVIIFSLLITSTILWSNETINDEIVQDQEVEEERDTTLYILFSPSYTVEQFSLYGVTAWDKFNVSSIDIDYTIFGTLNSNWGSYFRLSYNIPLSAEIIQLDENIVTYNPTILSGMGISIYVGAGYMLEFESMRLIFSLGPQVKLRVLEGEFLIALGGNIGTDLILDLSKNFYVGLGFNFGIDFWGYHNIGDEVRYNPILKPGTGIKMVSHIGFKY